MANIITEEEFYKKIEETKESIGRDIYSEEIKDLNDLIIYLKGHVRILNNIKNREIITPRSLVKRCISKTCKQVIESNRDVLIRHKINSNIDTLTVKQFSKLTIGQLGYFEGIKPLHRRELKEMVKGAGLEFYKNI